MEKKNMIKILSLIGTVLIIFVVIFFVFTNLNKEKNKGEKDTLHNLENNIEKTSKSTDKNKNDKEKISQTEKSSDETIISHETHTQEETTKANNINESSLSENQQQTQQAPTQQSQTQQSLTQQQPAQVPTQASAQAPTQSVTQQPAQVPTQAPTQAATQQPTQAQPVQKPTTVVQESSFVDEVIRLVNIERNNVGLSSLAKNTTLCQAAQTRANEIISVFDHVRPDGTSCFTVAEDYKIKWTAIGENIAMGQKTPQEVVNTWMNSQGHRENILNSNYNQIGVGVVKSGGYYYWVQLFIRS